MISKIDFILQSSIRTAVKEKTDRTTEKQKLHKNFVLSQKIEIIISYFERL